jgi:hypothetical protein
MPRSHKRHSVRHRRHRGGSKCSPLGSSMYGGSGTQIPLAKYAGEYSPTPTPMGQTGGYLKKTPKKGGSMVQSALVPLSLLGMQQYFGRSRKTRQSFKGFSRKVRKSVRRVF